MADGQRGSITNIVRNVHRRMHDDPRLSHLEDAEKYPLAQAAVGVAFDVISALYEADMDGALDTINEKNQELAQLQDALATSEGVRVEAEETIDQLLSNITTEGATQ